MTMNRDDSKVWLFMDGNMWCCGIGRKLQEGNFVFEPTPELAKATFRNTYPQHADKPIHKRTCRVCGCTDDHACNPACWWMEGEWDLCSSCASKPPVTLSDWQREIHALAKAKGWWNHTRSTGDLCSLMHSEVSELFEAYRNGVLDKPCEKIPELTNFEEETADIFIRLLDWCEFKNMDLISCVRMKHEYNRNRAYRHGGKKA